MKCSVCVSNLGSPIDPEGLGDSCREDFFCYFFGFSIILLLEALQSKDRLHARRPAGRSPSPQPRTSRWDKTNKSYASGKSKRNRSRKICYRNVERLSLSGSIAPDPCKVCFPQVHNSRTWGLSLERTRLRDLKANIWHVTQAQLWSQTHLIGGDSITPLGSADWSRCSACVASTEKESLNKQTISRAPDMQSSWSTVVMILL